MPLESMPLWIVTFGSAPSGSAPVSQASSSGGHGGGVARGALELEV